MDDDETTRYDIMKQAQDSQTCSICLGYIPQNSHLFSCSWGKLNPKSTICDNCAINDDKCLFCKKHFIIAQPSINLKKIISMLIAQYRAAIWRFIKTHSVILRFAMSLMFYLYFYMSLVSSMEKLIMVCIIFLANITVSVIATEDPNKIKNNQSKANFTQISFKKSPSNDNSKHTGKTSRQLDKNLSPLYDDD